MSHRSQLIDNSALLTKHNSLLFSTFLDEKNHPTIFQFFSLVLKTLWYVLNNSIWIQNNLEALCFFCVLFRESLVQFIYFFTRTLRFLQSDDYLKMAIVFVYHSHKLAFFTFCRQCNTFG